MQESSSQVYLSLSLFISRQESKFILRHSEDQEEEEEDEQKYLPLIQITFRETGIPKKATRNYTVSGSAA